MRLSLLLAIAVAASAGLLTGSLSAQTYPSRAIRLVVPFTPGTGMDLIARDAGPRLAARLGQPVVIDNRPGASGNLGAGIVAKSVPDGYTLMVSGNPLIVSARLYPQVPFEPLADFAPVSLAARGTLMLVVHPATKLNSVADLVARAKSDPGRYKYGSPGVGTPHHMSMELLKDRTDADLLHVPYRGSAGAVTDLLGGQIDVMFMPIHVGMPYVRERRLKALAVGSATRHASAPELPTLQEAGVDGAEVSMWYGFLAPRATPAAVIDRLGGELRAVLALTEVRTSLGNQGMDVVSSTPAEFAALMRREDELWTGIIRRKGITPD